VSRGRAFENPSPFMGEGQGWGLYAVRCGAFSLAGPHPRPFPHEGGREESYRPSTQLPWKPKGMRLGIFALAIGPAARSWASKTRNSLRSSAAR
jgi:hypothetical protein